MQTASSSADQVAACAPLVSFLVIACPFLEAATLLVLQEHLLTKKHVRLVTDEFEREMQRWDHQDAGKEHAAQHRLKQVTSEFNDLYNNPLAGIASPVLRAMIAEREAEKERLEAQRAATTTGNRS